MNQYSGLKHIIPRTNVGSPGLPLNQCAPERQTSSESEFSYGRAAGTSTINKRIPTPCAVLVVWGKHCAVALLTAGTTKVSKSQKNGAVCGFRVNDLGERTEGASITYAPIITSERPNRSSKINMLFGQLCCSNVGDRAAIASCGRVHLNLS